MYGILNSNFMNHQLLNSKDNTLCRYGLGHLEKIESMLTYTRIRVPLFVNDKKNIH